MAKKTSTTGKRSTSKRNYTKANDEAQDKCFRPFNNVDGDLPEIITKNCGDIQFLTKAIDCVVTAPSLPAALLIIETEKPEIMDDIRASIVSTLSSLIFQKSCEISANE